MEIEQIKKLYQNITWDNSFGLECIGWEDYPIEGKQKKKYVLKHIGKWSDQEFEVIPIQEITNLLKLINN